VEFTLENKKFQNFPNFFLGKTTNFVSDRECFSAYVFVFWENFKKFWEKIVCSGVNSTIFPISSEKPSKLLVSENWKNIIAGGLVMRHF
jgi:hypothetical protein